MSMLALPFFLRSNANVFLITCELYAPQRPRLDVISIKRMFRVPRSVNNGCVISSTFLPIETKTSHEYSAYRREAIVDATARFIFEAATNSIALVIFFVLFTLLMRLFISLDPAMVSGRC